MATSLNIIINGTDNASATLAGVSAKVSSLGDSVTNAGKKMTAGITLPLVGMGAAAIHMGNQFNEGMANVISLAPKAADEISAMGPAVQQMAIQMGTSTGDMTTGLYQVVSAIGLGSDTLGILEVNAMAAAAGLSTTEEAIALTTAVTKAYGNTTLEATQKVADLALGTVQMGQTTFPELAGSIGRVTPLAAAMGVSMEEMFGVMATGTGVTGSAAEVSTQFRGILQSLMAPTSDMTAAFAELGVETGAQLIETYGLGDGLMNIMEIAEASGLPLQKYMGSIEGQTLAMVLSGAQSDTWVEKTAALMEASGATAEAFAAQTEGVNAAGFSMKQAKAAVQVLGENMGNALMPAVLALIPLFQQAIEFVGGLVEKFTAADPAIQTVAFVLAGLAVAAGPVMMVLGSLIGLFGALLSPIGLIVLAVAGLAAAWAADFGGIRNALQPVIDGILTFAETILWAVEDGWSFTEWAEVVATKIPLLGSVFVTISETIASAMGAIRMTIEIVIGIIQTTWETHGAAILASVMTTWNTIGTVISAVSQVIQGVLGAVQIFLQQHGEEIVGFIAGAWLRIQEIIQTVLAIVQTLFMGIANFLREHGEEIQSVLYIAWTAIKTVISVALALVEGIVKTVLKIIKGDWSGAWETMKETAETIWNLIKNAIITIAKKIEPILAGIWESIKKKAAEAWENVKTAIAAKVEAIRQAIETWAKAIPGKIASWWASLKDKAAEAWEKVKTAIAEKISEVLENVFTWLDDTLYAIENFDLKAAAAHFFGTVLPGIAAKIGEALTNVGNWLKDTFNKIKGYDLKGASTTFFQTALAGIAAKITEALTKVGTWLKDTATKVSNFDLKAAAITLFQTALAGIITKVAEALTKVGTWLTDVSTKIKTYTFKSDTLTALQTVVAGIIEKAGEILTAVGNFLTDIGTKISEFSLFSAGANLIQGFIDGIGSMVGGAIAAAAGVVQDAINAAWAAVQPGSPSRVGRAIGANLTLGIAVGIEELAGAVVSAMQGALGDVTVEAAEQAAKIADAVATMIDTMLALIDAAAAMMAFQVPDGLTAAVDEIVEQIEYVVRTFAEAAENFEEEGLAAATAFAEAAGTIGENISAAVEGIVALFEYSGELAVYSMVLFLNDMMLMVRTFETAASHFTAEGIAAAAAFAEAAGTIGGNISAAVEGIKALLEYTGGLGLYAVVLFLNDMMLVVRTFETAASHFETEGLAVATVFAEAAGTIGGNVSAAVEGIKALLEYSGGLGLFAIVQFLQDMMLVVKTFETAASHFTAEGLATATAFAQAAGTIGGNISAAVEGIQLLMEYSGQIGVTAMSDFLYAIEQMVGSLAKASTTFDAEGLAAATAFAQAAGTIGGNISAAVEGIQLLMEYSGQIGVTAMSDFLYAVEQMVGSLAKGSSAFDADGLAAATAFAQAAGTIGGSIKNAIEGIKLLMEYSGGLGLYALVQFFNDVGLMVRTFETAAKSFDADGLAAAAAFATAAGTIGGSVKNAIEGIKLLMEYAGGLGLYGMVLFLQDVSLMVRTFENAADSFTAEGLAAATAFAGAAGTIGGSIKNAIEGISALLEYTGGLGVYGMVLFLQDMALMVRTFENAAASFTAEGLAAATAFAGAASAIGGSVKNAIEGIKLLLEYSGGLATSAVDAFVADIKLVVEKLEEAAADFSAEGLAAAVAFASAAGTIGGNIKNALEGLGLLLAYQGGQVQTALDAFVADMTAMIRAMEKAGKLFTEEGLAVAVALAAAAGTIGKNVGDAVEGLGILLEYKGGLAQVALDAFVADMTAMIRAMETAGRLFTEEGLAAATALAQAAGTIGKNVGDAIEGLGVLLEYKGGLAQVALDAFVTDISAVVRALIRAAEDIGVDGISTAQKFATDIALIASKIETTMSSLRTIIAYEGAESVTAMNDFLADVQEIVLRLNDARAEMATALTAAQQIETDGTAIGAAIGAGIMAATSTPSGVPEALMTLAAALATAMQAIQSQFATMRTAAFAFGRDWVQAIMSGMNSRLDDLEDLLEYIRGLFPSSPAKYGPWRTLPDGGAVGAGFASSMTGGLLGGTGDLVNALGGLRGAFGLSGNGFGGLEPVIATAGGGSITVNINNPTVRNDRDINAMAAAVSDVLARQAATNSRLGRM